MQYEDQYQILPNPVRPLVYVYFAWTAFSLVELNVNVRLFVPPLGLAGEGRRHVRSARLARRADTRSERRAPVLQGDVGFSQECDGGAEDTN
jgi:hypothetical protein